MNIQFTGHAIERIQTSLCGVTSYGEVQQRLSEMAPRNGNQHLLIKKLSAPTYIKDNSAIDGQRRGDKVWALCTVGPDGIRVDTVALSF